MRECVCACVCERETQRDTWDTSSVIYMRYLQVPYLQVPSNATAPLFQKSLDRHLKWVARYVLFGCAIDQNCNFVGVVLRPSLLQKAVSVF